MLFDKYPILIEICKLFLPSLITYFLTKYTIMRPKIYNIRKKQFNLIYLPLFLIDREYHKFNMYSTKKYINKSLMIINKNFSFVFDDTVELLDEIKSKQKYISSEDEELQIDIELLLLYFSDNIKSNYYFLRKYLGYPTKSPIDTIKRTDSAIISLLFIKYLLPPITLIFIILLINSLTKKLWLSLFFYFIMLIFYLYIIVQYKELWINKTKD